MKKSIKKLMLLAVALPATISGTAYDFEVDGVCYNLLSASDLTCEVTNGISYTGDIIIPSTVIYNGRELQVLQIGANAFANCENLENVKLGEGIETIKTGAFKECSTLKRLNIPSSIKELENKSFSACTSLEELIFEDSDEPIIIGDNGFNSGPSTSMPDYVTEYIEYLPNGVSTMCRLWSEGLFTQSPIKTLYIGRDFIYRTKDYDLIVQSRNGSKYSCPPISPFSHHNYDTVTIGEKVTELYGVTFRKGTIKTLNIKHNPNALKVYVNRWIDYNGNLTSDDYLFKECSLKEIQIDRNYEYNTYRSYGLFENISSLEEVIIGDNVTELSTKMFQDCTNLQNVKFGKSLKTIPSYSFYLCSNLKKVELPSNLVTIEESAFSGSGLIQIVFNNCLNKIESSAFYKTALIELTIPSCVTEIGSEAFDSCDSLQIAIMNCQLSKIPFACFRNCTNLEQLQLPSISEVISNEAFLGCKSLSQVVVPNMVSTIGTAAFNNCTNLKYLHLGKSITTIGANAFSQSDLAEIKVHSPNPPFVEDQKCFNNSTYLNAQLLVPYESMTLYSNADVWKNFWNIQEDPTSIDGTIMNTHVAKEMKRYDAAGREINSQHKGLNIIKMSDGTIRKIIIK